MYNSYYQNPSFVQNRNNVYNQSVRLQLAQEYYKRVAFNNKIQIINPDSQSRSQNSSPSLYIKVIKINKVLKFLNVLSKKGKSKNVNSAPW